MNDFDQAARYAGKNVDAEGFLRWLLPKIFRMWRWAGWLDAQAVAFPGEPERRCDTVAVFEHVAGRSPPVAVVVEFMTQPRPQTMPRQTEYQLRIHREKPFQTDPTVLFQVVGAILYLTGAPQSGQWAMAPPDFGGLGLWSKVKVLNLPKEDAAKTLRAIARKTLVLSVLPWVPLMRGADAPEIVKRWRKLAETEQDLSSRGDLVGLALVFANLAKRAAIWKKGLEGMNIVRSEIVDEWRAEGRLIQIHKSILGAIEARFGADAEREFTSVVESQTDPDILARWFKLTVTAKLPAIRRQILGK